ncbi:MAG: MlaD family protein [Chitinispirillaceae bacterium]|nr:MlaD family protein [Chitinispirillaceae bacterium]
MSLSHSQKVRLGIFLLLGIALLIFFVAIPLGFRLRDTMVTYFAYFEGESLSGLEQGATVKYVGVPIGKVEKINYLPNDLKRVKVTLKIEKDFPMKSDMYATTGAMGITGLKYIEINGGSNEAPSLKPGSEITTRVSVFSTITGKAEAIVAKIELLLNHLNIISNPDSLKGIKEIVDNVADITSDIKSFVNNTGPEITMAAKTLNNLAARIDSVGKDIRSITTTLERDLSGQEIKRILQQADSATAVLKSTVENLSLLIKQSRTDFTTTLENVRQASENAEQLTKILVENPSLLLRSETQRERDF